MSHQDMTRLKDEFSMTAQLRPATAEHYAAWLEEYLDAGQAPNDLDVSAFAGKNFYTVSADAKLPLLLGDYAVNIIVPPGVKLDVSSIGHCTVYFTDGAQVEGERKDRVRVWSEMLDMMIGDGYDLSRLVGESELASCVRISLINSIMQRDARSDDLYGTFSANATLATIDAQLNQLRTLDATGVLRAFLKLKAETPIDAAAQQTIDEQAQEALKTLQVIRYKLDPASLEPIAAFGKRAKRPPPPEEPSVELADGIQVGRPIKYKDQGPRQ